MSNLYVFRIEYVVPERNEYVRNELLQGRLRQGWGGKHTNLLGRDPESWIAACCEHDQFENNEVYYRRKFKNHSIMLKIVAGDIIIIPKTPDNEHFTICKASGTYYFDESNELRIDDYRHVIPIDVQSIRKFNYRYNEDCKNIHAKMRSYQSPINNVWLPMIKDAAERLINTESCSNSLNSEEIVQQIINSIYRESALQRFRNLGNREIERIVELIFEKVGYEKLDSNSYDREGGDADLIFKDNSLSEFCEVGKNGSEISGGDIYVQVKNKNGVDNDDIYGAKQLVKRTDGNASAVKILISTTDSFTQECVNYANRNNVLLIDGMGFLQLLFKYIH